MSKDPVKVIVVGAGDRANIYSRVALNEPSAMKIVGVVDPSFERREHMRKLYGFDKSNCYTDVFQLASKGKIADAIINCTMDDLHVSTSLPLLELGYDMLLEKPFATNAHEMHQLYDCVKKNGNKVMICHVLRYSPFYSEIKKRLLSGEIGEIINIQTSEYVSYHHMATSFVRGKWGNSDKSHTSMLLAKCCHDIDLVMWFMGDIKPARIASFGSKMQYRQENAPEGAGEKCLVDCPYLDECVYSAKRLYIDTPNRWENYVWTPLEDKKEVTLDDKIALLKTDWPYGRCVYKCDNNVVDHQSVVIDFANGATGTHNMIGGSSFPQRTIRIIGTKGEIYGNFEDNIFYVSRIDPSPQALNSEHTLEQVDLNKIGNGGGHGGGDIKLARDFVNLVRGDETSFACTRLENSIAGHACIYLADKSCEQGGMPMRIDL